VSKGRGLLLAAIAIAATATACSAQTSSPSEADAAATTWGSSTEKMLPSVSRVIDGDTIALGGGERIRLVQIDAPESKGECYGKKAGKVLRALLPAGTKVRLESDPKLDDVDRYGRLLRYVFVGKDNINVVLVKKGAASVWYFDGDQGRYAKKLLHAAQRASRERRGAWGACEAQLDPSNAFNPQPKRNEPPPPPPPAPLVPTTSGDCAEGYDPCLPVVSDLDCPEIEALGLAPVTVSGSDPYRLDGDGDGEGCE
jgi:endonuclease YncB( thermonuclease family)